MIKLKYTGKTIVRVEGFGKFAPESELSVSEKDAKTLLGTKLFKIAQVPSSKKTVGKDESPSEKKKEVK